MPPHRDRFSHYFDGQRYRREKSAALNNGIARYVCSLGNNRWRCPGRGKFVNDVFEITTAHRHRIDLQQEPVDIFLNELCVACTRQLRNLTFILTDLEPVDGATIQSLNNGRLRSRMRYWRKEHQELPEMENSYQVLVAKLYTERYSPLRWCGHGALQVELFNGGQPSEVLILTDPETMRILGNTPITAISCVTNDNIVPNLIHVEEVMIVMRISEKKVYPVMWICIKSRCEESYASIAENIKTIFVDANTPIHANFDNLLHTQLKRYYRNVKGTLYSHMSIMNSKAKELNINTDDDENITILTKFTTLPVLPAEKIISSYTNEIVNQMTAEKKNEMQQFLSYYEKNWIQSVGPEELSCFKNCGATDADQRSMLKILLQFNEESLTFWKFMEKIIHCQEKIHKELQARPQSVPHAWTPKVYPLTDDNSSLPKQWDKYANGAIDEARLMQVAAFCLRTSFLDNLSNREEYPRSYELVRGAGYEERASMMPISTARDPAQNLGDLLLRINPNARRIRARRQAGVQAASRVADGDFNAHAERPNVVPDPRPQNRVRAHEDVEADIDHPRQPQYENGNNGENVHPQRPNVVPHSPLQNRARAHEDVETDIDHPRQPQHENGLNDDARRQIIDDAIEQASGNVIIGEERIFDDGRGNLILEDDPIFNPPEDDYGFLHATEEPIRDFAPLPDDEQREQVEREVRQHLEDNDGSICVCCHTNPANVTFYLCKHRLLCDSCYRRVQEIQDEDEILRCLICRGPVGFVRTDNVERI